MISRNCPNCGAPYDVLLHKCPFCGTSYFDITSIDLQNSEECFLKIKLGDIILLQRGQFNSGAIEMTTDTTYVYGNNIKLRQFVSRPNITMNLTFNASSMNLIAGSK